MAAVPSVTLNFTMKTNLHLDFNYIENPLRLYGGKYYGLHSDTNNGVAHKSAGSIELTITPAWGYSGKLYADGNAVTFSGKLPIDGNVIGAIAKRHLVEKTNLVVDFTVDLTGQHQATGMITLTNAPTNNFVSTFTTDRLIYHKLNNPADAWTNKYTAVIPGFTNKADGPVGFAVATPVVDQTGKAAFTGGSVGDFEVKGTKFAPATFISKDGYWPFFQNLYNVKRELQAINPMTLLPKTTIEYRGLMIGWLQLATNNLGNLRPEGEVTWIKTGWTNTLYSGGFTNPDVAILASRWLTPTAAGQYPLDNTTTNWLVTLTDGNLTVPYEIDAWLYTNKVAQVPGQVGSPTASLVKTTGALSGKFVHPATSLWVNYYGVALQDLNYGRGWFMGTSEGGAMTFAPNP
jgi:hypothetical protein